MIKWTSAARAGGWLVLSAILGLTLCAAYIAATRLTVDTDTSAMLDPNLDFQVKAIALRDAFPNIKREVVVIVEAPSIDDAEAFTAALAARLNRPDQLFSDVFAPSTDSFFRENGLLYLPQDDLTDRLDRLTKAAGLFETLIDDPSLGTFLKTLAENDSLAEEADIGQDTLQEIYAALERTAAATIRGEPAPFSWLGALDPGSDAAVATRLLYATPFLDFARLQPARPALRTLQAEIDQLSAEFDGRVKTYVTGDPALRADELSSVTTGIGLSFAFSFVLVAILLTIAYRSIALACLTLLSLIITIVLTAGFAALTIGKLNLVSVAFTVLLVGLGLDFAIHLLLHFQERQAMNASVRRVLRGATHDVGAGLALAAPTTAIGFLAFIPTKFDGIAQLGIIAGAGVIIAFFVAITFLPAALGALNIVQKKAKRKIDGDVFAKVSRGSIPVSIVMIILGGFALTMAPQARFDADPMGLRDPKSPSVIGFNALFKDEDTIPYRLSALAHSGEKALQLATTAETLSTVRSARTLASFIPANQDDKLEQIDFAAGSLAFVANVDLTRPDANKRQGTPDSDLAGAIRLRDRLANTYGDGSSARQLSDALGRMIETPELMDQFGEQVFHYWPQLVTILFAQFNADFVDADTLPAPIVARYKSSSGIWRVDILPAQDVREPSAMRAFVKEVRAAIPGIAGGAAQTEAAGSVIAGAMLQATIIAFAAISFFLWCILRRFSDVLLMLFPIGLAAVLTLGASAAFDIPFNYANVIVLPLLLGIGVDSGIHLVMRHRHHVTSDGVFGASTPRAVFFAAATTVASFGSLMLSQHRGTASMGQLLSIAIAFTLICTLVVLPTALRLRRGDFSSPQEPGK